MRGAPGTYRRSFGLHLELMRGEARVSSGEWLWQIDHRAPPSWHIWASRRHRGRRICSGDATYWQADAAASGRRDPMLIRLVSADSITLARRCIGQMPIGLIDGDGPPRSAHPRSRAIVASPDRIRPPTMRPACPDTA